MDQQQLVAEIAQEVIARLQQHLNSKAVPQALTGDGVYRTVDEAVQAAAKAQTRVAAMSLEERGRMIAVIRRICAERCTELGRMEMEETKIGRLDHKIAKLQAMKYVCGVETMRTDARTDATGLCVIEHAPWGVIGMVLPATHSVPTMVSNAINILAAGNTAVFNPHPAGAKVAAYALALFNREIRAECGISDVITTVAEPTIQTAEQIFNHPDIALLCVTGGPMVVKAASKAGKRVIAGGPGNPPVVVDETADLDLAARCIIKGATFDNNLLCIGEKEIFVVDKVADAFIEAMRKAGAWQIDSAAIERLTEAAFEFEGPAKGCGRAHLKRDLIGKDAAVLARAAGVQIPAGVELLFGVTKEDHAFVQEEQMMPFVPVIRVGCINAAIDAALRAEHGYRHTAIIHTRNVANATKMARTLNTTLFVQNAPCTAALGVDGPGYFSHTIATPTGEGVTTPMTFTRERQIAIGNGTLRII
ncbi:MAG: aldehyde dehydrogenase family protein [Bryobacteraceae bacterium]|nr:aldehyde dehydrogenase family protein [Bryobacteraceae bacterium]